ncbi:MAG TPA: 4-hydroxyphenylacetate 3-hydroxylase N-terminal domain-containing protein, partial [Methylomirabilota bacterium]|nr:4-hydroxyphenylacetate 3-hydroxylase N-terminal domain-containing protein [Methylomirabilota bacterium]
ADRARPSEEGAMGARSGEQFLQGLRSTKRHLWLEGERVDDVTAHPALAGGARTLAGIFDRLHNFPDECLIADPETGEPLNIGHMIPRSIDDLKRRNRGLARIAEATVGLMGRTPDYMNVKFASFAGRWRDWLGADGRNEEGARNLVAFQKRLAREDISLTHTIIHPTIDKSTDAQIVGNRVPVHRTATTSGGIVVRGARILATLAPFADEIAVYPAHPLPAGAEAYALAFSIPVDTPGLIFMCRDSASAPGAVFDRPLSTRFDEQDAFVIFDDVEVPRERLFIDGQIDVYNTLPLTGLRDNMTNQTTIRALTKLEFAYGLATRMADAIGDASPTTHEMLGELLDYAEVARSAVLLSAEHGRDVGDGVWFPDGRPLAPMRSLLATWFPRVNEIIMLIGSHNLLAAPSRRQLDDATLRPLIDEFLHGAKGTGAEERAALFRLAWDFVGSTLAGRNVLYERFYLTSAARNRINHHLRNTDRARAYALVDGILAAGRGAGGLADA